MGPNEYEAPPPRVKIGPGKDQDIPLSWAEWMLSTWRERDPTRFGNLLAECVTGHKKARQR